MIGTHKDEIEIISLIKWFSDLFGKYGKHTDE
jgi:hypothetical protein